MYLSRSEGGDIRTGEEWSPTEITEDNIIFTESICQVIIKYPMRIRGLDFLVRRYFILLVTNANLWMVIGVHGIPCLWHGRKRKLTKICY